MTTETVLVCALASCGKRFLPSPHQVGARRRWRSCSLYCSPECQAAGQREKVRAWWRSPAGRRYARARRRAAKEKAR